MSTETVALNMGAGEHAKHIEGACIEFGIDTELRKSHFLGQIHVESGGFKKTRESLNYAAGVLVPLFGAHRISWDQATRYGRTSSHSADQEALANILYGGEWGRDNLGNTEHGDGWKFRGRSLKQITGRENYHDCSLALYGDLRLLEHPELLEDEPAASRAAGWFWRAKGLNALADTDNVKIVTKRINGGYNGLDARLVWTNRAKAEFAKLRAA